MHNGVMRKKQKISETSKSSHFTIILRVDSWGPFTSFSNPKNYLIFAVRQTHVGEQNKTLKPQDKRWLKKKKVKKKKKIQ